MAGLRWGFAVVPESFKAVLFSVGFIRVALIRLRFGTACGLGVECGLIYFKFFCALKFSLLEGGCM